jgi:flagellar hook-length control protein FliK
MLPPASADPAANAAAGESADAGGADAPTSDAKLTEIQTAFAQRAGDTALNDSTGASALAAGVPAAAALAADQPAAEQSGIAQTAATAAPAGAGPSDAAAPVAAAPVAAAPVIAAPVIAAPVLAANRAKPAAGSAKSAVTADSSAAKTPESVSLRRLLASASANLSSDGAAAGEPSVQSTSPTAPPPSIGTLSSQTDVRADSAAADAAKNGSKALPATPAPAAPDPGQSGAAAAPADSFIPARQASLGDAAAGDARMQKIDAHMPSPASAEGTNMTAPLQLNSAGSAGGIAPDAAVFKLHQGLETPEFSQALADRVSWLVDKDMGAAKLQINPPQLGPIEVRVEVQGDKAQVWLSAHSVVTRDVLDASSPKLREMLGSQGFSQVSVDISQRSFQDRPPPPPRFDWTPAAANSSNEALFTSADSRAPRVKLGALDAYA